MIEGKHLRQWNIKLGSIFCLTFFMNLCKSFIKTNEHGYRICILFYIFQKSVQKFYDLDDRINNVATKVVHLGDQLENISTPRQRIKEAQQVMKYFEEFNSPDTVSPIFNDPNQVLHESNFIMHHISLIQVI